MVRFQRTWEVFEFGGTYKTDRYYIYIHIWIKHDKPHLYMGRKPCANWPTPNHKECASQIAGKNNTKHSSGRFNNLHTYLHTYLPACLPTYLRRHA